MLNITKKLFGIIGISLISLFSARTYGQNTEKNLTIGCYRSHSYVIDFVKPISEDIFFTKPFSKNVKLPGLRKEFNGAEIEVDLVTTPSPKSEITSLKYHFYLDKKDKNPLTLNLEIKSTYKNNKKELEIIGFNSISDSSKEELYANTYKLIKRNIFNKKAVVSAGLPWKEMKKEYKKK